MQLYSCLDLSISREKSIGSVLHLSGPPYMFSSTRDSFIERLYGKTVSLQAESKLTLHNPYWIIKCADVPLSVEEGFAS